MSVLDSFDQKIMQILANDGRIAVSELAERIGLSKTPTLKRMRKLMAAGFITGYQARLNYEKLGENHIAFIQVKLNDTSSKALKQFNAAIAGLAAVEQCHMIAGNFDYLIKVRTTDIQSYRELLGEKIANLPYVAHTSTFVAMETICDRQKSYVAKDSL